MKRTRTSVILRAAVVAALSLAVGNSVVRGQRERRNRIPAASKVLESLKSLKCSFPAAASATWEGREPQVQTRKLAAAAVLTVFNIDTQDGSAEINGGGFRGADNVTVKLVGSTLHFLDIGLDGAMSLLTVFAKESHDGRLQAMYSRASYVENTRGAQEPPNMSQFYGDCEAGSR